MFIFGQALAIINGLFAIHDHRETDTAIYIAIVWLLYGLGRIDQTLRGRA